MTISTAKNAKMKSSKSYTQERKNMTLRLISNKTVLYLVTTYHSTHIQYMSRIQNITCLFHHDTKKQKHFFFTIVAVKVHSSKVMTDFRGILSFAKAEDFYLFIHQQTSRPAGTFA